MTQLLSKRVAAINYADYIVVLTVLYSLSKKLVNRGNTGKFKKNYFLTIRNSIPEILS